MTMLLLTHIDEYQTPKWRMRCFGDEKAFNFENASVYSLWDLRTRALEMELIDEDWIMHVADWIEHVIGHTSLAKSLRYTTDKWSLLITMERLMLRTLTIPDYVAKAWLHTANAPFQLHSGRILSHLSDLNSMLIAQDGEFKEHLERAPDDFANWIEMCIGDYLLAEEILKSENKRQRFHVIEDHICALQAAAVTSME